MVLNFLQDGRKALLLSLFLLFLLSLHKMKQNYVFIWDSSKELQSSWAALLNSVLIRNDKNPWKQMGSQICKSVAKWSLNTNSDWMQAEKKKKGKKLSLTEKTAWKWKLTSSLTQTSNTETKKSVLKERSTSPETHILGSLKSTRLALQTWSTTDPAPFCLFSLPRQHAERPGQDGERMPGSINSPYDRRTNTPLCSLWSVTTWLGK